MNSPASTPTPFDFRFRALVIFVIFFGGFYAGYWLQYRYFGPAPPAFVVLGERWGKAGIDAFAWIAALLTAVCWAWRFWGSSYLVPGIVMSGSVVTDAFTASGPYRYVRNPLYLGNIFLALGIGLLGPPVVTALVVLLNVAFVYRLIFIEERFLRATGGAAYADYCAAVPRLFPRLRPAIFAVDARQPNFANGAWTELYILGFVAAMIYVAVDVGNGGEAALVSPMFWTIALGFLAAQLAGKALAFPRTRSGA